jgi:hypothetical protein
MRVPSAHDAPMRSLLILLPLTLATPTIAQTLRCESASGQVTYAEAACPPGTTAVRSLQAPGKPAAEDTRAARDRLKADQQQVQKIERERRAEEDKAARDRAAREKREEDRQRACRKLAQRVADAEESLSRAASNRRDAAERQVRRAREDYAADCRR